MPSPGRWERWIGLVALVGFCIRVGYVVFFQRGDDLPADGPYYHQAANLLADGKGFIDPLISGFRLSPVPSAHHPPGWIVLLGAFSFLGLRSVLAHQLLGCLVGTATVVAVGFLGREVAGRRAGVVAALLAAVYPNFWFHDAYVMSESLVLLLTALAMLAAYRCWRRPAPRQWILLGLVCGSIALTRSEAVLLLPLLAVPLALVSVSPKTGWGRRLGLVGMAASAAALVLLPWLAYNLTRFEHPVLLTTGLGTALQVSNCPPTYEGPRLGYWHYVCFGRGGPIDGDLSAVDLVYRRRARRFVADHLDRLPAVVAARFGRTWGVFRPVQQLKLDRRDGREVAASSVSLGMYYTLAVAAVFGAVILRRRRVPLFPFGALAVIVTLASVLTFGQTRYRTMAEVAVVVLAAVAFDAAAARHRSGSLPVAAPVAAP